MSVLSGSVRPALSNAARRWACEALPSPSRIRATSALRAWLIATMLLHPSNRPTSNIQTNLLIVTDEANPGFELGINHLKLARVARPLRQLRWLTTPRFYDESSYQSQGDNAVNIDRELRHFLRRGPLRESHFKSSSDIPRARPQAPHV